MSKIYEALQRSQTENPQAPPLNAPLPAEAPEVGSGAAAFEPRAEVAAVSPSAPPAHLLDVPAERVLHPNPTPEQRLVVLTQPNGPGAEMFRVLSTRLAHLQDKRALHKLLITSSVGEEGKSVMACNLALTLARRPGERTLLIEADLRRPTASSLLTTTPLRGITEWSQGKLALEDALYKVGKLPLWFFSAGSGIQDPLSLLESEAFAQMMDTLSAAFDWVIIDSTPMLPMADATSLSRLCDGVMVVVREGHTRRKILSKALQTVDPSKLLGVLMNEASVMQIGYDRYYGSYGSYMSKSAEESTESDRRKAVGA